MAVFPFDIRLRRFGVALALYPASNELAMEIQRAPDDGAGAPDTGSAEIIDVVAPGTRTYVDLTGGIKHYRIRHISASGETGDWTHWVSASATSIPSVLPNVPKLRDPSIAVQETVGSSSFTVTVDVVDPDRRINSEIAFQTRTGTGAYGGTWLTSWDTSTGTIGTDGTLQRVEAVSFGTNGRASLKFRVQWEDDAGEQRERIERVELSSENVLKSANLRWVPATGNTGSPSFTTYQSYSLYADLQLGADVASVHLAAVSATQSFDRDMDISTDGELAFSLAHNIDSTVFWPSDEAITVTITPYDDTSGAAGSGDAGPSIARVIEPWGDTGSTGARVQDAAGGAQVFGSFVQLGPNLPLNEGDDGRPRIDGCRHLDVTQRDTSGTGEDTLETITIPQGTLGTDGSLRLECMWTISGTAAAKTLRVKFGGTTIVTHTTGATGAGDVWLIVVLANDGSESSQASFAYFSFQGDNSMDIQQGAASIDTSSADRDIVITGECADAGDTVSLRMSRLC